MHLLHAAASFPATIGFGALCSCIALGFMPKYRHLSTTYGLAGIGLIGCSLVLHASAMNMKLSLILQALNR